MKSQSKSILFTGASSGLGKDVVEFIDNNSTLTHATIRLFTAGRNSEDDFLYNLNNFANDIDFSKFDLIFHFAWDRSDLSSESINIRATRLLVEEVQRTSSKLVFISSVEAWQGHSEYAKQKRYCEDLVIAAGGKVLRLGAVIGGKNDFFSQLRKRTSMGPFKLSLVPDPVMEITRIETLAGRIVQLILNEQMIEIDTIVDKSRNLSEILKARNREITIRVPFWLVKFILHIGGMLVPALAVWRDRFQALETR